MLKYCIVKVAAGLDQLNLRLEKIQGEYRSHFSKMKEISKLQTGKYELMKSTFGTAKKDALALMEKICSESLHDTKQELTFIAEKGLQYE